MDRYRYDAKVLSVYDGDTITVDIDLGFGVWLHKQKIRLFGINTPEVRGPEKEKGKNVRDWLRAQILGKDIYLQTIANEKKGKYGRWLGIILLDGRNLNEEMLELGYAKETNY